MRRRLALALLPFVLALPLVGAACGGGEEEAATQPAAEDGPLETIEVSATEFEFEPAEIELDAAGTYRFVLMNDGGAPHALEIEGNGIEAETETIEGGQTAQVDVALEEGEYEIYCPVGDHADQGMVGRIVVGGSGEAAATDEAETGETSTDEDDEDDEDEGETTIDSSGPGY